MTAGTLHIHCGDSSAETLRRSGVPGRLLVWREIYTEGPVPGGLPENEWRRVRAEFLTTFGLTFEKALQGINRLYTGLAAADACDEVILWFDACMFDQTIMVHVMDRLAQLELPRTCLRLICISDRGLGELTPDEMAGLLPRAEPITPTQLRLAHGAWNAFTSDDPRNVEAFLARGDAELPHVGPALRRHLEQFPSVRNGLNRLQNQVLNVLGAGTHKLGPLFSQVSDREEQAFLGDSSFWSCLDGMARGPHAMVEIDGPGPIVRPLHEPLQRIERWTVTLTETGQSVLRGDQDSVRLNGIDAWLGGVHLRGAESQWRWDTQAHRLVPQPA